MSVTVKNPVIKQRLQTGKKPPLKQALAIIKNEHVDITRSKGWSRFGSGISTKEDSATKGRVFVNDNVKGPGTATNKQIGGWLQFGTPAHGPVKAKAMRWYKGSKPVFAKWVKGIKAFKWWGLTETIKEKVRTLLSKHYGR